MFVCMYVCILAVSPEEQLLEMCEHGAVASASLLVESGTSIECRDAVSL
jgi:hypothetical protein